MKLLPLIAILYGCVVPYGEAPQTSLSESAAAATPMGNLTGLEARLLLLMDENQDADRAARLEALRSLLRRSRTWTPDAQQDLVVYLEAILAVEERWRGDEGLDGFGPIAPVASGPQAEIIQDDGPAVAVPLVEEDLGDPTPVPVELPPVDDPVTVAPARNAEALLADGLEQVREALSREAYLEALGSLDELQVSLAEAGAEPDEAWSTLRQEAVDGYVHVERERAGKLFLEARGRADADAKRTGLEEVVAILEGLLSDYPDSGFSSAITRNLQLVKRELSDG